LGISITTFYKLRAKYGGMDVSMMSRIKELEEVLTTEEDVPRGKALG
jgi:putative transposase